MDALLSAILDKLPEAGLAGLIIFLIVVFYRAWTEDRAEAQLDKEQDREDYRAELSAAAQRHKDEIQRINENHSSEIAELKADIKELRGQIDDLESKLEMERAARRKAEDMAAEALRSRQGGS